MTGPEHSISKKASCSWTSGLHKTPSQSVWAGISFNTGDLVEMEFIPSEGYRYVGLYDFDRNLITTESTYTFTITDNTRFWVKYEEITPCVLNVTNDGYYYSRGHHKINGKL